MTIKNIKSINSLNLALPLDKGLYAITGQNGSGKSTVITCAASSYFNMKMNDYFGQTPNDATIDFLLNDEKKSWHKKDKIWTSEGKLQMSGFYEGSVIYGNRFRNTKYDLLIRIDRIDDNQLYTAPEFIRCNLGKILHNNENYYDKILKINSRAANLTEFNADIFYYQKGDKRVSQFHMSTGENLLISVLNSIHRRNSDRRDKTQPCLLLLDEIELALHPSSLKRLVNFLRDIANKNNYAVYFSTHAIELINSIQPSNIFFLERHADDTIEVLNPCYPAYATRILYDHEGYDYIIMVEDDLTREIVRKLLKDHSLINNKLVHVLPCGGYTNTIDLANEVISSNLTGKLSKINIVLDGDIKKEAEHYMATRNIKNNIPLNYLPIESLEKYLKNKLVDNVDHALFRHLNDFIFHQKSLSEIVQEYNAKHDKFKDKNGKRFFSVIDNELRNRNKNRNEIIDEIIKYLSINKNVDLNPLLAFLKNALS